VEVHFSPKGGCTEAVIRELAAAKTSVCVQAYSFTSEPIAKAILAARQRGLKVEVVLDKSNRTTQYSGATFLLNQGIDVLIDDRHAIAHNKVMILDGKTVITGSFNFTRAAEDNNAENLLIIHDCAPLAESYLANFREHQAHSEPYTGPVKAEVPMDPAIAREAPAAYVGSKGSGIYHLADCKDAARISPANRVEYDEPPKGKRLHAGCPK
jgi:phosphatidylserine/phosphatidylglycerophosphate/cardiolipin synthase-like enzyme